MDEIATKLTGEACGTPDQFQNAILITEDNFSETRKQVPYFARTIFKLLLRIEKGQLYIKLPSGSVVHFASGNPGYSAELILKNWTTAKNVVFRGTIGVAESYIDGDWDSPDVSAMLGFFLDNKSIYQDIASQSPVINFIEAVRHWFNRNTPAGSQRNIAAHYDLGNNFYDLWLDRSMTYSSAIYKPGVNSLESAQEEKYRNLAKGMGINKDSHVLEIGCGWGGFAEFVGREIGAKVTGLTISKEQLEFARSRIAKAGLNDRVELRFQDYRDETEQYDQIASIEMFEAVGEKYWPIYFEKIAKCLKPGGTAGLQIITINEAGYEQYRTRPDFIQKYIFPGGMLPSMGALDRVTQSAKLELESQIAFPRDYARTLREWRTKFEGSWNEIQQLGFDQRFKRMWEFYLHYCEAGFETDAISVRQLFYKHA